MARSHVAVAFAASLVIVLIFAHLVIDLGFPNTASWHDRLDQSSGSSKLTHLYKGKQSGAQADDPSSFLLGVGKADITGYAHI